MEWSFSWFSVGAVVISCIGLFIAFRTDRPRPLYATLQILTLISLCIPLFSPTWVSQREEHFLPLLVDISESFDRDIADSLLSKIRSLAASSGTTLTIVPFSGESLDAGEDRKQSYHDLRSSHEKLDIGHTNLERAISGALSENGQILLLSDGWENIGNVSSLIPVLKGNGAKIYPFIPTQILPEGERFKITSLQAPLLAPSGKSVDIRISLLNSTGHPQKGKLTVTHDKKEVSTSDVVLDPQKELLVIAQSDPSQEGIKEITATLTPEDSSLPSSSETIFLSGERREKVLLLSGGSEDARYLTEILHEQSYQLTALTPSEFPSIEKDLSSYSVIIFNNVGRAQLSSSFISSIDSFVKQGGGFLMIGGNQSFGLGGYRESPIEEILPVKLVPPQTVEKRVNVALELVLDKSLSMAQGSKMEFTKEAAREVVRNLKDEDYVGIIAFDDIPWRVLPVGKLSEIRDLALERIGRISPVKHTNLLPAIDEARRALAHAPAGRKHMIILTDGKIPDSGPFYLELIKDLRVEGITVSTILVGGEVDDGLLRQMADLGGGAFYQTLDPSTLPRIFLSDVKTRSGERTMKESEEFPVRTGPDELFSTTLRSFPPVKGYVQTKRREGATLELITTGNDGGAEPLLASWKVGEGRSAALTTDANGRWSAPWMGWDHISRFYTELVDSLRPKTGDARERVDFSLQHSVAGGTLSLDLSIFTESASGSASGDLIYPDSSIHRVSFENSTRGRYLAGIPGVKPGRYEFHGDAGGRNLPPVAFYLSGDLFGEKKGLGFNVPLLTSLASATKGAINPTSRELQSDKIARQDRHDLTPLFLGLAALFFTLAIVVRERKIGKSRLG